MDICIMGGGPAGLAAGHILAQNNKKLIVVEKDNKVGGLYRTYKKGKFRFDLGGHRFFTKNEDLNNYIKELMGDELLEVRRISKIFLNNRYFDYPLKPINVLFAMGLSKTLRIVLDYLLVKLKNKKEDISFEDWTVNHFGRMMFNLYFKPYIEKVWGIPCTKISADWAAQRIKGLSLTEAIKNAFFKTTNAKSLVDKFFYPKLGIGRITDRQAEEIQKKNKILLNASVLQINHSSNRITGIIIKCVKKQKIVAKEFISSIPLTELIKIMKPAPPSEILKAVNEMAYRDLIVICFILNREKLTDNTWIYIPDEKLAIGRLHEPKNWSPYMVENGKCSIVLEYFCSKGDKIWSLTDYELKELCLKEIKSLNFIKQEEVIDKKIIRITKAYPLYHVGYQKPLNKVLGYVKQFENLQIIGRYGTFRYNNMDHSLEMGIRAAKNLLGETSNVNEVASEQDYFEEKQL